MVAFKELAELEEIQKLKKNINSNNNNKYYYSKQMKWYIHTIKY